MGAWIEIPSNVQNIPYNQVAPYMGAWIEILEEYEIFKSNIVAPYMGAWIEINVSRRASS